MKTQHDKHPGFLALPIALAIVLATSACTDSRRARGATFAPQANMAQSVLQPASTVQFANAATLVMQMKISGTSLFLTGTGNGTPGFGFMRLEVSANPESPSMTFNQHDISNQFSASGWAWRPDWYGSGAIGIDGEYALLSGDKGMSVVSMHNTNQPVEIMRYPGFDTVNNSPITDATYQYTAIIPNGDIFYGFRRNDYVYTVQITSNGLNLLHKDAYNGGNVLCCVTSGTVFGGTVYVAFTDSIASFDIDGNRALTNPQRFNGLQATYIASTDQYIYVQHSPNYTNTAGQQYPRGIYAFDQSGRNVGFFPIGDFTSFAVNPNNKTLYGVRSGEQTLGVYRMMWQ